MGGQGLCCAKTSLLYLFQNTVCFLSESLLLELFFLSTSWRIQQQPVHLWLSHMCAKKLLLTHLHDIP